MKSVFPWMAGLLALAIVLAVWLFLRSENVRPSKGAGSPHGTPFAVDSPPEARRSRTKAAGLPEWVTGEGVLARAPARGPKGLPNVVNELAALCWGKSPLAANTIEVKQKLMELRQQLPDMSPEELQSIADFFRQSDQRGFKYHMLIAFRSWCGDPFVEPVAEYYESEPDLVGEALGYMILRTPKAAEAFDRLLQREVDPVRRAKLISRLGFVGAPSAEPILTRWLESGSPVDRRQAVASLARIPTETARSKVWEILNGDFEAAGWDLAESRPDIPVFDDLRAVATSAMLGNGSREDVSRLLERLKNDDGGDDAIAGYVEELFPAAQSPEFVGDVVDLMMRRHHVSRPLLLYIRKVGGPEHFAKVQRLLDLDLSDDEKTMVSSVLDGLR